MTSAISLESYLLEELGVTEFQLNEAKLIQRTIQRPLEHTLLTMGAIEVDSLPTLYAKVFQADVLQSEVKALGNQEISEFFAKINFEFLLSEDAIPVGLKNSTLSIAMVNPYQWQVIDYLANLTGIKFKLYFTTEKQLALVREQFEWNYNSVKEAQQGISEIGEGEIARLKELAQGAPTISLVNQLISHGVKIGASDLHIEPLNERYRARYRVDGILHDADPIPQNLQLAVISRIKILSGMDIAEKRRPQDGKIETIANNVELDIRCSSLPLGQGESMVMRFLLKQAVKFDLKTLGYEEDLAERIAVDLKKTAGVILMTGPTGSGKTTSLYSYLTQLNKPDIKIITLEDPIEYQLDGINQVQVNSDIGYDFAKGLRSIVRQDPDVIMVGEIRDNETARIALQSALTGHLVFSTVHTNDTATAYTRLLDLGVKEYLLNAALVSVLAQRLVRKLCSCAASMPQDIAAELIEQNQLNKLMERYTISSVNIKQIVGCENCGHSGYQGRVAILEYLPCDHEIKQLPKGETFFSEVASYMQRNQLRTLREDGFVKVLKGETTIEEVLRVTG